MGGEGGDASRPAQPRPHSGEVLHQRRRLPMKPTSMAVGGFIFVATLGYFTLYHKAKPGTTAREVASATVGSPASK
ncbi:hypothetical protein J5N97_026977 [Dioscorea zingiberensis]|uniref:Uncharacterized protein n=1 Tax=Dioscorea zingiberensis TaxID=325984 RepID=A0A9D5H768_9LILI|nr:hypothetical protein J5N97_026977 [Dioscorea zingiberensis]